MKRSQLETLQKESQATGLVNIMGKKAKVEPCFIETVSEIICDKKHTPYDFFKCLCHTSETSQKTKSLEDGLNILQASLDQGRLSFLPVIIQHGLWEDLSSETVPDNASNSSHRGKTARQIAEGKHNKKSLQEYNKHQDWEHSLTPLMKSCRVGDIEAVMDKLKTGEGEEIFAADSNGGTALYWAVVGGDLELFQKLIAVGLNVKRTTKHGDTLLHLACGLGQYKMVEELLQTHRLDASLKDRGQKTCHERVAENGDIDTLEVLLRCEVQPESSVASLAAFTDRRPYLDYLFDVLKLSIDSPDMYDRTALHRSLEAGNYELAKGLVDRGAGLNLYTRMGRNVLHIIAEQGNVQAMEWMLSILQEQNLLRDMIDTQDRYTGTELCFLVRGRDNGRDAYHYIEMERWKSSLFLKKYPGGNLDVAQYGRIIKSGWGMDPDKATVDEIEECFKHRRLNQNGELDQTPLHVALAKSHFEIAKLLIQRGADIHKHDKFGQTPIFLAVSRGSLETVSLLQDKGANLEATDGNGKTLLEIAQETEQEAIVKHLQNVDKEDHSPDLKDELVQLSAYCN